MIRIVVDSMRPISGGHPDGGVGRVRPDIQTHKKNTQSWKSPYTICMSFNSTVHCPAPPHLVESIQDI